MSNKSRYTKQDNQAFKEDTDLLIEKILEICRYKKEEVLPTYYNKLYDYWYYYCTLDELERRTDIPMPRIMFIANMLVNNKLAVADYYMGGTSIQSLMMVEDAPIPTNEKKYDDRFCSTKRLNHLNLARYRRIENKLKKENK